MTVAGLELGDGCFPLSRLHEADALAMGAREQRAGPPRVEQIGGCAGDEPHWFTTGDSPARKQHRDKHDDLKDRGAPSTLLCNGNSSTHLRGLTCIGQTR